MVQNLQIIKEVCNDIGLELDGALHDLEKFKAKEAKTQSRIDEYEDQLN